MTQEQQNKTIAKHCGWRQFKSSTWEGWWYKKGTRPYKRFSPDYCNDLNAMHEAEELFYAKADTLEGAERIQDYSEWLCQLANPLRTTAAQRAEAFLRTLNLWQDDN